MQSKKKIIVVDDEKDIRDAVSSLLNDYDFEVEIAKNGAELLKKLPKVKPDLILLDIIMPGLTTYEITTELEKRKDKTPIIFLTVVRFADQTKNIMTSNMVDYIEKPFDNKDLIKRIKNALAMR
jgi:CheY-like chemotaxis protein